MKSLPIAWLLLGMASSPALTQPDEAVGEASAGPATSATTVEAPAADDGEIIVEGEVPKERRRVCEMQTTTGSIMPKRVCRTVAQAEEDARVARESMEIMKRDHDSRGFVELSRQQGS